MKVSVNEDRTLCLEEVYSGIGLRTREGNELGICMRDDTFEIHVMPGGDASGPWWRVNMKERTVEPMAPPVQPCPTCGGSGDELEDVVEYDAEGYAHLVDRVPARPCPDCIPSTERGK